jgi:hypothetical protein
LIIGHRCPSQLQGASPIRGGAAGSPQTASPLAGDLRFRASAVRGSARLERGRHPASRAALSQRLTDKIERMARVVLCHVHKRHL